MKKILKQKNSMGIDMKILINRILFLLLLFAISFPSKMIAQETDIAGSWQGALKVSGIQLRIVFNISKSDDGNLKATMDSPDQGANDIPVEKATLTGNKIKLEMPKLKGEYNGILSDDGSKISGKWSQAGQTFNLDLEKKDKPIVVNRPQEPKKPYPYNSADITFKNEEAGITLAGTFTSPKEEGPFPAVILITGSGAQNRNEELLGHKPFLVLSDYLTKKGIAVLRYDDRGTAKSTGDFKSATSEDFATDVMAAIKYLKTRDDVKKDEIGLIGHSEGGLIAPIVATKSDDVAFIVMMAGPGLPGDQILLMQSALIDRANGESEEDILKSTEVSKKIYQVIKSGKDSTEAYDEIKQILSKTFVSLSDEDKKEIGSKENMYKNIASILSPWFINFITYDPRPTLEKVECPVLAINGEKDLQVPPKEDIEEIEKALKNGGNENYKTEILPGLNHLFQTAETGSPIEYNKIEETISPIALKTIGDWILEITK